MTTYTRKTARKKKERETNLKRVVGVLAITGILAGGVTTPAMAADSDGKGIVTSWHRATADSDYAPTYSDADQLDLTDSEADKLRKVMMGEMDGEVTLSADSAIIADLAAKGINIDIEASQALTNKHLGDLDENGIPVYALLLVVTFDEAKITATAEALNQDPDTAVATLGAQRADAREFIPNIGTDEVLDAPIDIKAGDRVKVSDAASIAHSANFWADVPEDKAGTQHLDTGAYYGPGLFPNVDMVEESPEDSNGERSFAITTLTDPFSDGTGDNRQQAITDKNERGLPNSAANCLIEDCGTWLLGSVGGIAIADALRIDVGTTVSAGKAPVPGETITFASGDSGTFVGDKAIHSYETNGGVPMAGDYYNGTLGQWKFAAENGRLLTALAEENALRAELGDNVRIDAINTNADGSISVDTSSAAFADLEVEADNGDFDFGVSIAPRSGYHLPYGLNPSVPGWEYDGELLEEGDTIEIGGVAPLTATIASIDEEGGIYLWAPNDDWGPSSDVEDTHNASFERYVEEGQFTGQGAVNNPTPGYSFEFEKTSEEQPPTVEEPVLPEPEALPDSGTGKKGEVVRKNVIDNDIVSEGFELVPNSLRLVDPDIDEPVMSVKLADQGEYRVDGSEVVEFAPEPDFTSTADELEYVWSETNGEITRQAGSTIQVTILPEDEPTTPPVTETPQPPVETPPTEQPPSEQPPTEEEPPSPKPTPTEEKPEPVSQPPVEEDVTDLPPEGHFEEVGSAGFLATPMLGGGLIGLFAAAAAFLGFGRRKQVQPIKVEANQD